MTELVNESMILYSDDDASIATLTLQEAIEPEWTDELERWVMASST
ncbi:MAG: hypothetical protein WCL57_12690 [Chloroflexota bacterium]|jgi:hypothetical protein|nr:hypothetical protein [Chloroflexota bacterium]